MRTPKDLSGMRFGRLLVTGSPLNKSGRSMWKCVCVCGKETMVYRGNLVTGEVISCGCLQKERASISKTKHGQTTRKNGPTIEYRTWCAMKTRCKINPRYKDKGIIVCKRWLNFQAFFLDMGPRPSSMTSIDRIDNNGNYEPGNCRWATTSTQCNNRKCTIYVKTKYGLKTLSELSKITHLSYWTLYGRYRKQKVSGSLQSEPFHSA